MTTAGPPPPVMILLPFLLGILVLDVTSMWSMTSTYDEGRHLEFGKSVLERRLADQIEQKMAISLVNYLPVHALGVFGIDATARTSLFLARLPTVLASLGLMTLVFRWARRLYGLRGALLSATLYTVCPTVIAHSRLATNDLHCAALMFAATMLFVADLEAPTAGRLVLCAAVTGLAQISKHTALLLLPIFGVLWTIAAASRGPTVPAAPARRHLAHVILAVIVVLAVMNAGYLFRGTLMPVPSYLTEYRAQPSEARDDRSSWLSHLPNAPVPFPHDYVHALATGVVYNEKGSGHGPVYLLGELSRKGWWYYFFVAFGLKTPLGLILLVVAAALSPRWFREHPLDESALLTAVAVVFAFFSFVCTAQLGIRYVLPAFPFLFVAVGKAAAYTPRSHAIAYRGALAVLVWWAVLSSVSFHPHYLSYFNELIGDRKNMWKYLADSNVDWGQSNGYLVRYLETHGAGRLALVPDSPVTGRVIVTVNSLVGVTASRAKYAWLRDRFAPVDHVGYSWLVYEIPREGD